MADKKNGLRDFGYALSKGAAAFGQGLTGTDYLGQFEDIEEARAKVAEQNKKNDQLNKGIDNWISTSSDPTVIKTLQSLRDAPTDVKESVLTAGLKNLTGAATKTEMDKFADAVMILTGKSPMQGSPPALTPDKNEPQDKPATEEVPTNRDITPGTTTQNASLLTPQATVGGVKFVKPTDAAQEESISTRVQKTVGQLADFAGGTEVEKQRTAHNTELISGMMYDLSDNMASAYDEGSIGDIFKDTETFIRGFLGGDFDISAGEGLALKGKFAEVVLNIFPLMTQQIGKEGSIRLMESVLKQIRSTLPTGKTSATTAKKFLRNTIVTLYRKQRAITNLVAREGSDVFQKLPGEGEKDYVKRTEKFVSDINAISAGIIIEGKEKKSLDTLVDTVTSPLDKQISREAKRTGRLTPEEIDTKRKRLEELKAKAGA